MAQRSSLSYDDFSQISLNETILLKEFFERNDKAKELKRLGFDLIQNCDTIPVINVEECSYSGQGIEVLTYGGELVYMDITSNHHYLSYEGDEIRVNDDKSKVKSMIPGITDEQGPKGKKYLAIYIGADTSSLIFEYDEEDRVKRIKLWADPI